MFQKLVGLADLHRSNLIYWKYVILNCVTHFVSFRSRFRDSGVSLSLVPELVGPVDDPLRRPDWPDSIRQSL